MEPPVTQSRHGQPLSQTTLYYARLKNVVLLLEPPNRPIGQPRNAVEARPASRVSGDVTARAELTDARPKYLSLLYNTEAVAAGNHASSDQDSTNDPGLFLQPVVFDENSIEMLCAHFGPLGSFRLFIPSKAASDQERDSSIDRLPCPHDGLRLPEMNGSCWEVKWSHRDDSASALMTLRRVPPLTVTWAHQSAPCPSKDHNAPSTPSNDDLHHPQPVMGSSWVLTGSRDSLAQQQYSHYGHGAPTPANLPGVDVRAVSTPNSGKGHDEHTTGGSSSTGKAAGFRARICSRRFGCGGSRMRVRQRSGVRRPGATHPLYNRNSSAPQTSPSTSSFFFQRFSKHSPDRSAPSNACSACASPQTGISNILSMESLQYSPRPSALAGARSACASPQMGIFKFIFSDLQDTHRTALRRQTLAAHVHPRRWESFQRAQ
ncbi:hypothetical protein B0H16DRAFT_1887623, partial [Mycena metata]